MARKKEPPKPLFAVKHDFVAALDNLCQEAIMLLQAVDTIVKHDHGLDPRVKEMLHDRAKAMRAALSTEE